MVRNTLHKGKKKVVGEQKRTDIQVVYSKYSDSDTALDPIHIL